MEETLHRFQESETLEESHSQSNMAQLPSYVNITGDDTLVRDTHSMGILNMNKHALEEAKTRHRLAMDKLAEERRKETELNTLRKEVDELKMLVKQMLEKK